MQIDETLGKQLSKKWGIPFEVFEHIIKEYKSVESKRKFIKDTIEQGWPQDDD